MKKLIALFVLCYGLASCASVTPIGAWDYTVTGTPNGDYAGVMTVTKEKEKYTAMLKGEGGEVPFNTFSYDKKTKKGSGDFTFQGTPIQFEATVTPTAMEGSMGVEDGKFPFKATKKK